MSLPKWKPEYIRGIHSFIEFASRCVNSRGQILCPCRVCYNRAFHTLKEVSEHLIAKGMISGYVVWSRHGEQHQPIVRDFEDNIAENLTPSINVEYVGGDNMEGLFEDMFDQVNEHHDFDEQIEANDGDVPITVNATPQTSAEDTKSYERLVEQASSELYPGCKKYSKLSFIMHLYQLKCLNSWTATSFNQLLELLIDVLPEGTILPRNTYEVKKIMKEFDLGYNKIDACPNDCMLFWSDMSNKNECQVCGASRWVSDEKKNEDKGKKKSAKIARYFPLIPRLQRLYKSKQPAEDMIWHEKLRKKDGLLRHPADGEAWRSFDARYPEFAADPRNVRLGLVSDGFNPFKTLSSTYSIWQ